MAWLTLGIVALLVAAVAVALWEHRAGRARVPPPGTAAPRVSKVDVPLDSTLSATLAAGDQARRRATLDGALDRMAQRGESRWLDTQPTVGAQLAASPQPTPRR